MDEDILLLGGLGGLIIAIFLIFPLPFMENEDTDPVMDKIQACETRAAEILGGSPQFERDTEEVTDDKYTITGKIATTFDDTKEEQTYTCTVEVVDGESIAKIDSIR